MNGLIGQVSQLWNLALVTSSAHNDRRLAWIALRYILGYVLTWNKFSNVQFDYQVWLGISM